MFRHAFFFWCFGIENQKKKYVMWFGLSLHSKPAKSKGSECVENDEENNENKAGKDARVVDEKKNKCEKSKIESLKSKTDMINDSNDNRNTIAQGMEVMIQESEQSKLNLLQNCMINVNDAMQTIQNLILNVEKNETGAIGL